jgi:wobble nucleotide-excising tRNase
MNQVASYKKQTALETDKKVNIIYGLNGTGKTTISDFLYKINDSKFTNCSVDIQSNESLLVYNTTFIQDIFYSKPNLNGIFTLSKENKIAAENIKKAEEEIGKFETKKKEKDDSLESLVANKSDKKQQAVTKVWEIKTKYTGGDRVLEYCLDKYKGSKDMLFEYLCNIDKPETMPAKTIDELKKEVALLKNNEGSAYNLLPKIQYNFGQIETDRVFAKIIIGNENSIVAGLINKLNNADWVKLGLNYIPDEISIDKSLKCPFCQQETITKELLDNINNYFDEEYEKEINKIKKSLSEYADSFSAIKKENYENNPFVHETQSNFEKLYDSVVNCLKENIRIIQDKINSPSQIFSLINSTETISEFNSFIDKLNIQIEEHNTRIANKQQSLNEIKIIFWNIMRYNYDVLVSDFIDNDSEMDGKIKAIQSEIQDIETEIKKQKQTIEVEQRKTINIDEAIENINKNLSEFGMDGFKISKYLDNFYKIIRDGQKDDIFKSLSEGEKMIISFLYFLELCKGKKEISETTNKKIIVIDDPISSLSHIYIFNIGELIKREFFRSSQFEQVFVLTHSLYFFYEITETNHDKRKKDQKLFRIIKNFDGSSINEMNYEEIQNDYQSYWYVINDPKNPHALIANCMRNIVEYFFNFIEKNDLNNVFQKPNLQDIKFRSFYRFINRESHSLGQNIFDYKEFDYDIFKEALKLVFYENGYQEHYDKMAKII